MAVHGVARLQLAVDAAVALFHPARIPGHVHVEQIPALGLQVQPFAGGVGGDQNPQRMVARIGVEGALDRFAFLGRGRAVIDGDAFAGAVGPGDGAVQLLAQIALGVVVFGEQDHPRLGPVRRGDAGRHGPAQRRQVGAQPGTNPVHQLVDAGIGLRAGGVGDGGHALQQPQFLGERGLVGAGGRRHGRRHGRRFHLGVFLGLQRLFAQGRLLVVAAHRRDQQVQPLGFGDGAGGLGFGPLPLHGAAMHPQSAGKGFDGREQPLLQVHQQQAGRGLLAAAGVTQALFAALPVLIQQPRQFQLRRVLRQAGDVDLHHLAPAKARHPGLAQILLEPPHHDLVQPALARRHASAEPLRVEQFQQGGEAVGVPVVRGGRQKQAMLEARGKIADGAGNFRVNRVAGAAGRGGVVGFVEDQQRARAEFAQPVAQRRGVGFVNQQPLRHQKAGVGGPRVRPEAARLPHLGQIRLVENLERQAKAGFHLVLPLQQHGRRTGHHDLPRLLAQQ